MTGERPEAYEGARHGSAHGARRVAAERLEPTVSELMALAVRLARDEGS